MVSSNLGLEFVVGRPSQDYGGGGGGMAPGPQDLTFFIYSKTINNYQFQCVGENVNIALQIMFLYMK